MKEILENDDLCMKVIKDELQEIKDKYGDERKTDIVYASEELNPEDFYADDEMIITISTWDTSSVRRSVNSVLRDAAE